MLDKHLTRNIIFHFRKLKMRDRVLASLVLSLCSVSSFYLPGLAPVTYCDNTDIKTCSHDIKLFVNRLNSEESVIPYEYHQ